MGKPRKASTKAKGITANEPEKVTTEVELTPMDTEILKGATKDLAAEYNTPQPPAKKQKKAGPLVPTTKVIPVPENPLVANTTRTTRNTNLPSRAAGVQKTLVPAIAPITQPSKASNSKDVEDEEDEEDKEEMEDEEDKVEEAAKDTPHGKVGDQTKNESVKDLDKKASKTELIAMLSKEQKENITDYVCLHMYKEYTFRARCNRVAAANVVAYCEQNSILKGALKCSIKAYMRTAFTRFRGREMKKIQNKIALAMELDPEGYNRGEFLESFKAGADGTFPSESVQSQNAKRAKHGNRKRKADKSE